MKNRILFFLMTVVLALCASQSVFGQQTVFFSTPEACTTASAGSFNYYSPLDVTRQAAWKERVAHGVAQIIEFKSDVCVLGRTAVGERIYRVKAGNSFFSLDGKTAEADGRCGNLVDKTWSVTSTTAVDESVTAEPERVVRSERTEIAFGTNNNVEFVSAPLVGDYVPINRRATTVVNNTTTINNTSVATTTTLVSKTESVKGEGWCQTYVPGPRTLYVGGWIGQQFKCHPKRTTMVLLGAAAAVPGIAYATNSLWWATNNGNGNNGNNGNGNNGTIYGYPISDWEAGPCSLWAQGGKYFGRRPIPARCF